MVAHGTSGTRTGLNRRRGIRWHLLQVQLFSIVPLGIFAAAMLYLHWQVQERERQRSQIETVRLMAAAVDNALDSTVERLAIFARLWSSSSLDEEAVYGQAREALLANADWINILAFDADGRGVFRADAPFGSAVPDSFAFPVWRPVFEDRRAVVSDVLSNSAGTFHVVAVGVPVIRGGRVDYVLIAALDSTWYDRLLNEQGQPEGAVAALFDRQFKFVARSSEGAERRGQDPTVALVRDMQIEPEGLARYVNLNGTEVYTAWTFTRHGWGVGFGTPSAPVDSALWNHLLLFGFLWAAAVGGGMLYAFAKARPIAASLVSLENQARELAVGGRISDLPDSRVEEVNRALGALEEASDLLQSTMAERDRSLATEREARAAAEAANHAKDEFLAMLGHELRNPLAAIVNAVTIARSDASRPDQLDFATGVIERQSRHLKRLIDDLLDVGRAMTGKIALDRRPMDVSASARQVVDTLTTAGRLADRRVDVQIRPVWIDGDPTRIEQVITNLLGNAARYTAAGGRIRLEAGEEGGEAVIRVTDNGRGISAENLARVFDLFFQADATADRAAGGLGIGLTLVQRIARLHGGDVHAASAGRGQGATFTVRLPATAARQTEARRIAPPPKAAARTVLVVEDNADTRESLCVALELRGFGVLRATNGYAALELIRREAPQVAVLDIGLPGMDGFELARQVRRELGPRIKLLAVTGYGSVKDVEQAARAGFDLHLTKPVDVDELVRSLAATPHVVAASRRRS